MVGEFDASVRWFGRAFVAVIATITFVAFGPAGRGLVGVAHAHDDHKGRRSHDNAAVTKKPDDHDHDATLADDKDGDGDGDGDRDHNGDGRHAKVLSAKTTSEAADTT